MSTGYAGNNFKHILTLGNSIIGVSVLAMPFCFKQCGLVLGILLLFFSSYMNRLNCHFLIKAAIATKRRSYEFLAFQVFGAMGKFAIEVVQIGFLFGICVSFFVIAGDLGPTIVARMLGINSDDHLRACFLTLMCFIVVLPLCLLRNIDSLASLSAVSLTFYALLAVKIFSDSWPHIAAGSWLVHVRLWRPEGVLQTLPIMALALACQTNVFSIYDALPEPSLPRMNAVVAGAINLCCSVYVLVGFFGYVALNDRQFGGNLLNDLTPSPMTRWINTGFVMSIAMGFPLIIFPCRVSLNSLLFRRVSSMVDVSSSYIPDFRFQCITFAILSCSLLVGILVPSIEVVLGLLGSTMGTVIAILFPSAMFIRQQGRDNLEGLAARACFVIGLLLLVCGTYVNLYAADQMSSSAVAGKQAFPAFPDDTAVLVPGAPVNRSTGVPVAVGEASANTSGAVRHEPANPQPPLSANSAHSPEKSGGDSLDPQAIAKHEEELAKYDGNKLTHENKQEQALHDLQVAQKEQKAILKELLKEVKDQKKLVVAQGNPVNRAISQDNRTGSGPSQQELAGHGYAPAVPVPGPLPLGADGAGVQPGGGQNSPRNQGASGQAGIIRSAEQPTVRQGVLDQSGRHASQDQIPVPQNMGPVPQNAGPVQQNVGPVPQNVGQVPQNVGQVPQNMGQVPQNAGPVAQNMGQVRQNVVQVPQNAGPVAQNVGQVRQNVVQVPQNAGPVAQNVGQLTQNMGQVPQNAGPVAQNVGQVRQNVGQAPQNTGQVPQNMGQFRQNAGQAPQNVGPVPQNVAPAFHYVGQVPQYAEQDSKNIGKSLENSKHENQIDINSKKSHNK